MRIARNKTEAFTMIELLAVIATVGPALDGPRGGSFSLGFHCAK